MSGDPTISVLEDNLRENADAQPMTAYCGFCPKWRAEGTAAQARKAAEARRKEKHPETFLKRRVRRGRAFSQALSAEKEAEIEQQRRQRMRSMGLA